MPTMQHAYADNARLVKTFPKGFALDATHHAHLTMLQQFVRTADLDKLYAAANKVMVKEKAAGWKLKAGQVLLHSRCAYWSCGHCRRADRGFTEATTRIDRRGCTFHRENWDRRSVRDHRGSPRYPTVLDRIRGQFCADRLWQEIQSARHHWCRYRSLPEGDARRTVRAVHVFAGGSVGLPTGQFGTARKELRTLQLMP